jgi:hypothetical protein
MRVGGGPGPAPPPSHVAHPPGARALFLCLDYLDDQLQVLIDPGGAGITVLEGGAPVGQMTLGRELVEALAADLERGLGVGRQHLGDDRPGHLDAV